MERQYTRLDSVRNILDGIINSIENPEDRRGAYVHLYGTGLMASVLALKRGFDRETAELAEIAGMLHDLLCYVNPEEDGMEHAPKCAEYAKENVLSKLSDLTDGEKQKIYYAILNHSNKHEKGDPFDEIIKDADAAHHALRNPMEDFFFEKPRIKQVVDEICGTNNK